MQLANQFRIVVNNKARVWSSSKQNNRSHSYRTRYKLPSVALHGMAFFRELHQILYAPCTLYMIYTLPFNVMAYTCVYLNLYCIQGLCQENISEGVLSFQGWWFHLKLSYFYTILVFFITVFHSLGGGWFELWTCKTTPKCAQDYITLHYRTIFTYL